MPLIVSKTEENALVICIFSTILYFNSFFFVNFAPD